MSRWLTDEEQHAWRRLGAILLRLPLELDRQLQRDSGISHFEYWTIAMLSEAPDRRLQLKDLAGLINSSPSRLSHVVRRLEQRGWVVREPNATDARATDAVLTDEGLATVVAAAPGHAEAVLELVLGGLDAEDLADLSRIADRVLDRLDLLPQMGR